MGRVWRTLRRNLPAALCAGAALALAAGPGACERRQASPRPPGPLRVVVTVAPLAVFARELAPEDAQLTILMPPGRSIHGYEMTPADAAALGRADVVVYVGLGLEPQAARFLKSRPSRHRRVVEFAALAGAAADDDDHHHHADDGHDHHGADPHLWLDPALVAGLVPAVRRAVEESLREQGKMTEAEAARLDGAERSLLERIGAVDEEYRRGLEGLENRKIVTHHNSMGRLAERYGLEVAAVIRPIETSDPTPAQLAAAVAALREQGARAVFFEPQFDAGAARRIAERTGARLGRLDPEGGDDWFAMMRENLESLVANLSP